MSESQDWPSGLTPSDIVENPDDDPRAHIGEEVPDGED